MRLLFFCLVFTIVSVSCTKTDKKSENTPCSDSCTTVQGRFLTGNNEPVAGIFLEIRSESRATFGLGQTTIRKIANGKTDAGGFYSLTFSLQPGEYGNTNKHLYLKASYDKSKFLAIPWYDQFGTDEMIPVRDRKDTTVIMDYFLATKTQLTLRLTNFVPPAAGDSFYVLRRYHDVGYNKRQATETEILFAQQTTTEKTIGAAGNQQNRLTVVRKKNGIRVIADTLVFTPGNQNTTAVISY